MPGAQQQIRPARTPPAVSVGTQRSAACLTPLAHALRTRTPMATHSGSPDTRRSAERRTAVRIDVLGQIDAHSMGRLRPLQLLELSETGFSVESTGPFEPDVVQKFRLGIEGHGRSIVVQAKARHCALVSASRSLPIYVTGFKVVNADDTATRELRSFVRFADDMWREKM